MTAKIKLARFEERDIAQLLRWVDSERLLHQWGGAGFTFPLTDRQLKVYIRRTEKKRPKLLAYKAVSTETGKTVGHISLGRIDRKHGTARIGRVLVGDPEVRGQGIGEAMMEEVLKIAFDEMGLHRVGLGVFDFNRPAIRCYEKVGFVKEGLLRDTSKVEGEYWSLWEMSMLENEWRKKQQGSTGNS